MRALGLILVVLGSLVMIAAVLASLWLVLFGCGMAPAGCRQDALTLFLGLLVSDEAVLFWGPFLAGGGLAVTGWLILRDAAG